jgi:acetyl esterase/lipase
LASYLSTHLSQDEAPVGEKDDIDKLSDRPDLQVLIYPVIDFELSYHTCSALLGHMTLPPRDLLRNLSTHHFVSDQTPPAFVFHTTKDHYVPIQNSYAYVEALKQHNVSHEFVYGDWGDHGIGLTDKWTTPLTTWLTTQWNL